LLQVQRDSIMHGFTGQAYRWIVLYGARTIIAVILFIVGQWVIRILNSWFRRLLSTRIRDSTLRPFVQNLLQIVLQLLLALGLMQVIGIRMTVFAAVIGALGVAIGLALSGTLQNFAAGVLIILLKPFVIGDNIKTQGEEGTVIIIRLFYTVIRTFSNTTLIVPNSKLSNEVIFNLTREKTRRMELTIKFNYEADLDKVKAVMLNTVSSFEKCLQEPAPRIGVDRLEPDGFTVSLNAWLPSHGFQDSRLEFNERLMRELQTSVFARNKTL
jgi:small conductance mechanosensitive channel